MELVYKIGELYHVALNKELIPEIDDCDEEDFAAYISFEFMESLPGFVDMDCYFGFELSSRKYYIDGWSMKDSDDRVEAIQHYLKEALVTLRKRNVLDVAISDHAIELEWESKK